MNNSINIVEIGMRDGFQSCREYIPLKVKTTILDQLASTGVKRIQCTSFVSPKAIPQMRDASQVVEYALTKYPNLSFFALVPNFRGAQAAYEAGLREVTAVVSLSESHNKANINMTRDQSIKELYRIAEIFPDLAINIDVATAFGCPFEGYMDLFELVDFVGKLSSVPNLRSVDICDTIGVAYPSMVRNTFVALRAAFPEIVLEGHIHDTRNMGMMNSMEALRAGADGIQTALGGLGGCPFAPGASGNTATEDLLNLLTREGFQTGIDAEKLLAAARYLHANVEGNYSGHLINIEEQHCHAIRAN